eukprot:278483-Chlamydomonas_euryale.AAC.2
MHACSCAHCLRCTRRLKHGSPDLRPIRLSSPSASVHAICGSRGLLPCPCRVPACHLGSDLADGVSELAAQYWGSRPLDPRPAQCALQWLHTWAVGGGMTGQTNSQGRNHMKFRLTQ